MLALYEPSEDLESGASNGASLPAALKAAWKVVRPKIVVPSPAGKLSIPESDRLPHEVVGSLGCQVGRQVRCRIFDSPRFGVSGAVNAEVVVRGVGVRPTANAHQRLRELLVIEVLTDTGLHLPELARRITQGLPVFK